jgi:hypothetical protein
MTVTPDQLRWEITPVLWAVIDGTENIVLEVLGQRATLPDVTVVIEALRQAQAAQRGDRPDAAILTAEITKRAAVARHDQVRQHITHAAEQQLLYGEEFHVIPRGTATELAAMITADAMAGMGPLFAETVTSVAATVLADLPGQLATVSDLAGQLLDFTQTIAGMRLDAACDGQRCDSCGQSAGNAAVLDSLIEHARDLLGITGPEDPPSGPVPLSAPPISPNGIGPIHDTPAE